MLLKNIRTCLLLLLALWFTSSCQQAHSTQPLQEAISAPDPDTISIDSSALADTMDIPLDINYIMGRFEPASHPDFILVNPQYADKEGMYLRKDTYAAFLAMHAAALEDGVKLQITSATRNFNAQKRIWEAKWTGERLIENGENLSVTTPDPKERAKKILRYSSMPGSSRHHWGTDMDLNSLENDWFESGEGLRMYNWLTAHAHEYGFCQPYSAGRPHGYFEERWHWSYMPVSARLTDFAKTHLKNEMIDGFLGCEAAATIDVVKHYVLGINEECK